MTAAVDTHPTGGSVSSWFVRELRAQSHEILERLRRAQRDGEDFLAVVLGERLLELRDIAARNGVDLSTG